MRRVFYFLLAIMPFAFISCSKDDSKGVDNSAKILGVWFETSYWDDGAFSGRPNTWHQWNKWGYVHEFKADKTYRFYWSVADYREGKIREDYSGTYSFDGQNLYINGGFKKKITFSEDGNSFEWEQTAICERGN